MSKEQIEQMEHDYKNAFPINIEWLLEYAKEQAELVDDMMRLIRYHKEKQKEAENENEPYRHQNRRYRQALEFYADKRNWKETVKGRSLGGGTLDFGYTPIQVDEGMEAIRAMERESE